MRRLIANLKSGDQGPDTANLQEGLNLLLDKQRIAVPADQSAGLQQQLSSDATNQAYGDATAQAVRLFQEQHNLEPPGTVDGSPRRR